MRNVRTKPQLDAEDQTSAERQRPPWLAALTAMVVLTAVVFLSAHAPGDAVGEVVLPMTALLATAVVAFVCLKLNRRS